MIPRIIHYCWFGHNPKPKLAKKCIKSWKKKCPDYQIIEWNEDNFDISKSPLYVRQAYEAKKWAFVTDYVRLKVVYDCGGIYLDTDVELRKNLDFLLNNKAYFGLEWNSVATGLGFGAEKGTPILRELFEDYNGITFFNSDGSYNEEPCPVRNTRIFEKHGLIRADKMQILDEDICILPREYMAPLDYWAHTFNVTNNTISIHWYSASWMTKDAQSIRMQNINNTLMLSKKRKTSIIIDYISHFPNRVLKRILGNERYETVKKRLKR